MFYGVSSNTMSGSTFGVSNGMANSALSFATVTDIRDTDIRVQPQVLLNNMNGWGLVDKQRALYPFVSDGYIEERATQHKYNLINPADTDAAFRLVFSGGWTHSATGAKPNGSTGYATTYLASNALSTTDNHLSYYSRTNILEASAEMGSLNGSIQGMSLVIEYSNGFSYWTNNDGLHFQPVVSNTSGFFCNSRVGSTVKLFKNSTSLFSEASKPDGTTAQNIILGARNDNGTPSFYSTKECAFCTIGAGLSDTDEGNFRTIVDNFELALSRNV